MLAPVRGESNRKYQSSRVAQSADVAHQLLLDFPQEDPGTLIILFRLRGRQVSRKLVKMNKNGPSNIFVGGVTRPEIRWCSAGNGRDVP